MRCGGKTRAIILGILLLAVAAFYRSTRRRKAIVIIDQADDVVTMSVEGAMGGTAPTDSTSMFEECLEAEQLVDLIDDYICEVAPGSNLIDMLRGIVADHHDRCHSELYNSLIGWLYRSTLLQEGLDPVACLSSAVLDKKYIAPRGTKASVIECMRLFARILGYTLSTYEEDALTEKLVEELATPDPASTPESASVSDKMEQLATKAEVLSLFKECTPHFFKYVNLRIKINELATRDQRSVYPYLAAFTSSGPIEATEVEAAESLKAYIRSYPVLDAVTEYLGLIQYNEHREFWPFILHNEKIYKAMCGHSFIYVVDQMALMVEDRETHFKEFLENDLVKVLRRAHGVRFVYCQSPEFEIQGDLKHIAEWPLRTLEFCGGYTDEFVCHLLQVFGQKIRCLGFSCADERVAGLIPAVAEYCPNLRDLSMVGCGLKVLPEECFKELTGLTSLDLSDNPLVWPNESAGCTTNLHNIFSLTNLRSLNMSRCNLAAWDPQYNPSETGILALDSLILDSNRLQSFPYHIIRCFPTASEVYISNNEIADTIDFKRDDMRQISQFIIQDNEPQTHLKIVGPGPDSALLLLDVRRSVSLNYHTAGHYVRGTYLRVIYTDKVNKKRKLMGLSTDLEAVRVLDSTM